MTGGALQILRFNWPTYLLGVFVCVACRLFPSPLTVVVFAATAYWSVASLAASYWVYDRSPLMGWKWLPDWLGAPVGRWIMVQTGFDSTKGVLAEALSAPPLAVVDLYGTPGVGGASVRRARAENAPSDKTLSGLPLEAGECDAVLAIFSLHEIRAPEARVAMFEAFARTLAPRGRLVVVEHLRDWRNFLAFGPGFLHFRSDAEWRRCAGAAGFVIEKSRFMTPFVHAYCWRKR